MGLVAPNVSRQHSMKTTMMGCDNLVEDNCVPHPAALSNYRQFTERKT